MSETSVIPPNQELIDSLEELLVKQFRALQTLVKVTREEREVLTRTDAASLKPLVEEKEVILDQLGVLEDSSHMLLAEIAQEINADPESLKIKGILSLMEPVSAERIRKICEGISTLSDEAHDLNLCNQALASNAANLMEATQNFLISLTSSVSGTYDASGSNKPYSQGTFPLRSIDHRA